MLASVRSYAPVRRTLAANSPASAAEKMLLALPDRSTLNRLLINRARQPSSAITIAAADPIIGSAASAAVMVALSSAISTLVASLLALAKVH